MRFYWISVGPNPIIGDPVRRENLDKETRTQGRMHVMTEAEIGMIHLQTKEYQRLPETTKI